MEEIDGTQLECVQGVIQYLNAPDHSRAAKPNSKRQWVLLKGVKAEPDPNYEANHEFLMTYAIMGRVATFEEAQKWVNGEDVPMMKE